MNANISALESLQSTHGYTATSPIAVFNSRFTGGDDPESRRLYAAYAMAFTAAHKGMLNLIELIGEHGDEEDKKLLPILFEAKSALQKAF